MEERPDFSLTSDLVDLRLMRFLGMGLGVDSEESRLSVLLLPGVEAVLLGGEKLLLAEAPEDFGEDPIGCGGLNMDEPISELEEFIDLTNVKEFCEATSESEYIPNSSSGPGDVQGVMFIMESEAESAGDDGVSYEDSGELNLNRFSSSSSDILGLFCCRLLPYTLSALLFRHSNKKFLQCKSIKIKKPVVITITSLCQFLDLVYSGIYGSKWPVHVSFF